jgi:hypothetical protein
VRDQVKAFEKYRFRPTYAGANVGHPSLPEGLLRITSEYHFQDELSSRPQIRETEKQIGCSVYRFVLKRYTRSFCSALRPCVAM